MRRTEILQLFWVAQQNTKYLIFFCRVMGSTANYLKLLDIHRNVQKMNELVLGDPLERNLLQIKTFPTSIQLEEKTLGALMS